MWLFARNSTTCTNLEYAVHAYVNSLLDTVTPNQCDGKEWGAKNEGQEYADRMRKLLTTFAVHRRRAWFKLELHLNVGRTANKQSAKSVVNL